MTTIRPENVAGLGERATIATPTVGLRWVVSPRSDAEQWLQQAWQISDGSIEWRNVPTVLWTST